MQYEGSQCVVHEVCVSAAVAMRAGGIVRGYASVAGRLLARVGWMLEPAGFSQGRHSYDHTDEEEEPDGYQEWKSVSHLLPPPVVFP